MLTGNPAFYGAKARPAFVLCCVCASFAADPCVYSRTGAPIRPARICRNATSCLKGRSVPRTTTIWSNSCICSLLQRNQGAAGGRRTAPSYHTWRARQRQRGTLAGMRHRGSSMAHSAFRCADHADVECCCVRSALAKVDLAMYIPRIVQARSALPISRL
jgi:hypothetical protein